MYPNRYLKNGNTLSERDNEVLREKKVFIAGAGGLGGYVLEILARAGVGHLIIADSDIFDETNLNRQILCSESVIGQSKAKVAEQRVLSINSEVAIEAVQIRIDKSNVRDLCRGSHVLVDALDNASSRLALEKAAESLEIPLVHGAVSGWTGQVSVVYPGDRTLSHVYGDKNEKGAEAAAGVPAFTPAVIAGLQAAEVVKVLLGKEGALKKTLLFFDLLHLQSSTIAL